MKLFFKNVTFRKIKWIENCCETFAFKYKTRNSFGFIFFTSFATIKTLKIGPSTIMHLSMFSPRGGGGGIPWGLDKSSQVKSKFIQY